MRRAHMILGCVAGALIAAGCARATTMSFGPESEAAVADALAGPLAGEAALSVDGTTYFIPASRLREELNALAAALRNGADATGAPRIADALIAGTPSRAQEIVTLIQPWIVEIEVAGGTLYIQNIDWHLAVRAYTVGLIRGNELLVGGTKKGSPIDSAWKRLVGAAREQSNIVVGGYDGRPQRPLKVMRDQVGYWDAK